MKNLKKICCSLFFILILFTLINPVFASMEACNNYLDVTIDEKIASTVRIIILIIQIVVPILLVIFGSIDFVKAVVAQKEDEIKKGQQTFIKRVIAALLVFFVVALVKFAVGFGAGNKSTNILNCVACFTDGPNSKDCSSNPTTAATTSKEGAGDSCKYYLVSFKRNEGVNDELLCAYGTEKSVKGWANNRAKASINLDENGVRYQEVSNCDNVSYINICKN